MKTFRLKKGADRRVRQGHPWVFASELAHSAREIEPGEVVELRDALNHFLAYGYGHPTSQICFRKLSSRSNDSHVLSVDFFKQRLRAARELRRQAAWSEFSHRWVYAEADGLPGLVVDAFRSGEGTWLASVQASTAGMERALPNLYEALATFAGEFGGELAILEAPSKRGQAAEGMQVTERRLISGGVSGGEIQLIDGLRLKVDLLGGQKTGFFLDQQHNASLMRRLLRSRQFEGTRPVRVLDVCCYVGQWAAHSVHELKSQGRDVEVTLVDTSATALNQARDNVQALGASAIVREGDALTLLGELDPSQHFDVVICDPPAFVKKKADLESGLRAYVKLNRDSFKLARPGGLFVASSCSGLVRAADYVKVLAEAGGKCGRSFRQLLLGGHGPDHPIRPDFPEGEYLKCMIGQVDYPF